MFNTKKIIMESIANLSTREELENQCKRWLSHFLQDREYYMIFNTIVKIECRKVKDKKNDFIFDIHLLRPGIFIGKAGRTLDEIKEFLFDVLKSQNLTGIENSKDLTLNLNLIEVRPFAYINVSKDNA